jgi:hypothetical protein
MPQHRWTSEEAKDASQKVAERGKGFQSMTPEQRRALASKAGKKAHEMGRAHKWTSEEAGEAARKGVAVREERKRQRSTEEGAQYV